MSEIVKARFVDHAQIMIETEQHLLGRIVDAAEMIIECYKKNGGVFLFGNGGSAADAQHIVGELVGRFQMERRPFKAQALSTDTSTLTAIANDYSYDAIFTRQLEANSERGDVAFGLSTSGNSPNVVAAMQYAKQNGLMTIALTGQGGGKCAKFADVLLDVPAIKSPRVQEAGMVIYHILCELVEAALAEDAGKDGNTPTQ